MLRMAAIGLAAFISNPAAAQSPPDALRGVWQGTLGDQEIVACFDGNGVFYRRDDMDLVLLMEEENGWREMARQAEEEYLPNWQLAARSDGVAQGIWREVDALQEINLQRLSWTAFDEYSGPCSSDAFIEPRLSGGTVAQSAAVFEGLNIVQHTYIPPAHFQSEYDDGFASLLISTFTIPVQRYRDGDINAALTRVLPDGNMGDVHADCFAMVAGTARDADYSREIVPEMVTERWVVAMDSTGLYCGGAHPSHWSERRVFDRNSGEEVDAENWLNENALASELVPNGENSYVYRTATDGFRDAVIAHLNSEQRDSCGDAYLTASSWTVGLAEDGIALIPMLPHVVSACAETVVLPWEDAEPYLTLEGQAVRLSMQS